MDNETKNVAIGVGVIILLMWLFRKKPVVEDTGAGGGGGGGMLGGRMIPIPPTPTGGTGGTGGGGTGVVTCPSGQIPCTNGSGKCYDPNASNVFIGSLNGVFGEYMLDPCNPNCTIVGNNATCT